MCQTGDVLPAEAEYDSIKCSAFIDGQLSKTPPTSKQVRASATCPCVMPLPNRSISPVSPISAACTQIEYARVLATRAGVEIPLDVQQSSASISKFIEQYADRSGQLGGPVSSVPVGTMPSEKQLLFAARLARERGLGLSLEARLPPLPPPAASSRCLPLPLPDPPTRALQQLAISSQVLSDKRQCSSFIDDLLNKPVETSNPQAYPPSAGMAGEA